MTTTARTPVFAAIITLAALSAPARSGAQPTSPTATPTPTPTPAACSDFNGDPTRGPQMLLKTVVIGLRNGEAADFTQPTPTATPTPTPQPGASAPTPTPVAPTLKPTPTPAASPIAVALDPALPRDLTKVGGPHANHTVCLAVGEDGFKAFYAVDSPHKAVRKRNGVPMSTNEDRLRVRLTEHNDPHRWFAITVNGNGKCVVHGYALTDDQNNACKVAALPTPAPASKAPSGGTSKPDFPCPDWTPAAPKPLGDPLCASVTVGLDVLQTILTPIPTIAKAGDPDPRPDLLDVCVQVVPSGADDSTIDPQCQDPPPTTQSARAGAVPTPTPTPTPKPVVMAAPATTFRAAVSYYDDAPNRWRLRGQLGNSDNKASGGGGGGGSSGPSTSAIRRVAGAAAPSTSQSQGSTAALSGLVTLVHPFSYNVRSSIEYQNNNLISSADKQTQLAFSKVSAAQLTADQSTTKLDSTLDKNDTFQNFDATRLFGILQRSAVRGRVTPSDATKPSDVFDYTDFIDLAPFDPSTIKAVTYGGKLVWTPASSMFATGYYRDYKQGASGTMLHGERTFGAVTVGVSEVVANSNTPSSNLYLTTGPDGKGSPRKHSGTTVVGVLADFGLGGAYQAFSRLGITNTGNDYLGAISWSSPGGGRVITDTGNVLSFSALAGYRAIDPVFDPLATRYNPFTGTQLAFGRVGGLYTQAGTKDDVNDSLYVSVARAKDSFRPVYSSVGVGASVPLGGGPFSLDLKAARSTIAGSVVARQSGSVVVTGANATALLDNSFMSASFVYSPSDLLKFSIGNASTHSPTCDTKTGVCSSTLTNGRNGITASALVGIRQRAYGGAILDGSIQPGSVESSVPGGSTIATNGLKGSLLAAYHLCTPNWNGIEPTVAVKNSISEDESGFTPGLLIENGLDIGFAKHGFWSSVALRVSWKRVFPAPGQTFSGRASTFNFQLVSPPRWEQYSKIDPCASTSQQ